MLYQQTPTCGGFNTTAAMLAWTAGNDPINVCSVPLAARSSPGGAQIMIAGPQYTPGFDGLSQGGSNIDVYNFDYWQYVDVVIAQGSMYTIPPVGWMNTAHRQGALILGSIMTYWEPVFHDFNTNVLATNVTATAAAQQLAAIAGYYGFDGYFLDVEAFNNGGNVNAQILQTFLQTLRASMQGVTTNAMVCCYDCVSNTGAVDNYENELDSVNQMYFQNGTTVVSDAFMPNGDWGPQQLKTSFSTATKLGRSPLEVYMECFAGSGGVQTYQQVQQCATAGLSAAIWSPSWTFDSRTDEVSAQELDEQFWGYGKAPATGIASAITPRTVPVALPFCTTFNTGVGRSFTWPLHATLAYGSNDWNNLSLQDVVTTYRNSVWDSSEAFTLNSSMDAAFDGGASLLLASGSDAASGSWSVFDLFATAWPLANGMQASYTFTQAPNGSADMALGLVLSDQETVLLLVPANSTVFNNVSLPNLTVVPVQPSSTQSVNGWTQRAYDIPSTYSPHLSVVEVLVAGAVLGKQTLPASTPQLYLGQIVVTEGNGLQTQPSSVTDLTIDAEWITTPQGVSLPNLLLSWTAPSTGTVRAYDICFNTATQQTWVGRTVNTTFWLGAFDFTIPAGTSNVLTFTVQVIGGNGVEQSIGDAASAQFAYSPT